MSFIGKKKYYKRTFFIGVVILIFTIICATNLGIADISFKQTFLIILSKIPLLGTKLNLASIKSTSSIIILKVRLPRIVLSVLVGAGLSVVGTSFQGMFKNPMAEPYVLGISSGAAFGATLAMISGLKNNVFGISLITFASFLGAIITTIIVYNIARVGNKIPNITLLLSGISVSFFLSALISLIMIFNREHIETIIMWTMGSVASASWDQVVVLTPLILIGIIIIFFFAKDLNMMLLGDESAKSLGVEVTTVKKILLIISSMLVAGIVSVSGIIGFVGLIIPHGIRLIFGSDNRVVIPFSALAGSIFLIICDTIARVIIPPSEIPVGIITSIFGVPFFIYLLYKTKKKVV